MKKRLGGGGGEHLELEEHGLELMMEALGLEDDDLCRKGEDDRDVIRDRLDDWIANLQDDINPRL